MEEISIAIVDDQKEYLDALSAHLKRYESENRTEFSFAIDPFTNVINFLDSYQGKYKIIFMDIAMPQINGLDAAKRLRAIDPEVLLIFCTNFAQYAINAYEVSAFDYIVKPVNYYDFALKLTRALKKLHLEKHSKTLTILAEEGYVKVPELDITYLETDSHHVIYHTKNAEFRQYSSLRNAEKALSKDYFVKCNSCYIINLLFVTKFKDYTVTVDSKELQVSHPRKKELTERLKALK